MTNTNEATTARPIDADQTMLALRPARMEMGIRNARTDGTTVSFQVGMGPSTCWVEVRLSVADLYEFEIFKVRGTHRTPLVSRDMLYAEHLASALVGEWCTLWRKGW